MLPSPRILAARKTQLLDGILVEEGGKGLTTTCCLPSISGDLEDLMQADQREAFAPEHDHLGTIGIPDQVILGDLEGLAGCCVMGMVKMDLPTETSMPSMMAMVRGIFNVVVMPLPGSLVMETVPPTSSTFFFTTSMPTPRPENSVTSVLVEKPGSHQEVQDILVGVLHIGLRQARC